MRGMLMNLPTPSDLKKRRIKLGLTQSELAKGAGVSQSLIARIESGNVDPRLSTLQKIVDALYKDEKAHAIVRDIMHSPVIYTKPTDSVENAVEIMEKYGFSQVPVIDNGVPVGSISEDMVVRFMTNKTDNAIKQLSHIEVQKIMEESFPTVSPNAEVNVVSHILEYSPAVLILDQGRVIGVVTKHDVMRLLHG